MRPERTFTYANPHLENEPGIIRDPFIIRSGSRYYLTGTLRPIWAGPNPGVPLWSSADLLTWQSEGLLVERARIPADAWYRDRFWAPEIHETGGEFYLTVNCRNESLRHKHAVAIFRASQITGPYTLLNESEPFPPAEERHYPPNPEVYQKYIANDASLFTDTDGKHHIFWAHHDGIHQGEIELPSCRLVGKSLLAIACSRDGWDTKIEGPVIFRHADWFYMFFSSFTRDYDMGIARARKITGPWQQQPNNPIISPRAPLTHVGHNGVFMGPDGRLWISYIMQFNGKESPERLAYDPIWFDAAGWVETNAPTLGRQTVTLPDGKHPES
jgi:beta-xylosidase